jgi:hypothetical protein
MGEPLPIDLSGALTGFLEAYTERHEDVLVLEALSNAIDAKAKNVHITLKKEPGHFYIKFADDGPGMSKEQFMDYHTVSLSRKQKGEGIGFVGVGAKIYLASRDGSEILTVTSTGANNILASKMYRIGKRLEHETSLKIPIEQIISNSIKIKPFIGTWYQVKLTEDEYYYFCNNLQKILQKWFSHAMMHDSLKIYINHEMVEPIPLGISVKKIINYKQKQITCYFYYENEVQEENKHLVYTVFGKRIMNEAFEFAHRIIEDRRNKVFGLVDVTVLSKYLAINKEEFKKDSEVNVVKTKVRKEFYDFLKDKGFIKDSQQQAEKADLFTNEFARRLDKLLQQKEFKFLNPFNDLRIRTVVLQTDGNVAVSQVDSGQQVIFKTKRRNNNPRGGGGIWPTGGDESESNGFVRDDVGAQLGKNVETKAKGLFI